MKEFKLKEKYRNILKTEQQILFEVCIGANEKIGTPQRWIQTSHKNLTYYCVLQAISKSINKPIEELVEEKENRNKK